MTMTPFSIQRDINGNLAYDITLSNTLVATTLAANVEQTTIVPSTGDATYPSVVAVMNFNGANVWTAVNHTATIPGGAFAATNSFLSPPPLLVKPGDVLHFITADANAYVPIAYFAR